MEIKNKLLPNNKNVDHQLFVLDPLSVIIKLAIVSNKPIGTKISISKNIIYLQEPGPFQGFLRYLLNYNKTDLQYLYNPIEIACKIYLNSNNINNFNNITELFRCAQNGLVKLMETYKQCSIIRLCLNYYFTLISNYLNQTYIDNLFKKDEISALYTIDLIKSLTKFWTQEKIDIVLNIISFLMVDDSAGHNVKSLENIMDNIDKQTQYILNQQISCYNFTDDDIAYSEINNTHEASI
jgi:hypothetical protein